MAREDARLEAGAVGRDQRIALRAVADAEDDAADVGVDHDLAVAQRPAQPGFPGAQVVAAPAPFGRREHRLFGLRQEELQPDVAEVEAAGRKRRVVEEVERDVGVGMAGRRIAVQAPYGKLNADFYFRGGCTLIVDGRSGKIRFLMSKNIASEHRLPKCRAEAVREALSPCRDGPPLRHPAREECAPIIRRYSEHPHP